MSAAGADHHLAVEDSGLPGRADAGTDAPLAAGQGGVAHALGAVGVVAGDDQAGIGDGVGGGVVAVERWDRS